MADVLSLDNLKSAGFNDTEIKDYTQTQSTDLLNAGFSQQEVNNYYGIKEPDITKMVDFWKSYVSGAFSEEDKQKLNDPNTPPIDLQQTIENVKLKVWGKDGNLEPIYRKALGDSTFNTMFNIHSDGKTGYEMNLPLPEGMGFGQKLISSGLELGFEIPGYAATTALSRGNLFLGVTGWGTIRSFYSEMRQGEQVRNWDEFSNLLFGKALSAGVKEGLMVSAGAAAGKFSGSLGGGTLANALSFSSGMSAAGVILGDEIPDPESFLIQTILGLPAGRHYVKKNIDKVTNETGLHQSEILEKVKTDGDLSVVENLTAVNSKGIRSLDIIFKEEVPKIEQIIVNGKLVNEPVSEAKSLNVQLDNAKLEARKIYEDARLEAEKIRVKQQQVPTAEETVAGVTGDKIILRNRTEITNYIDNKIKPYFDKVKELETKVAEKEIQLSKTEVPKDPDAAKIYNENLAPLQTRINSSFDYKKFKNGMLYYGIDTNSLAARVVERAKQLGIEKYDKTIDPYKLITSQPGYVGIADSFVSGEGTRTGFPKGNTINGKSLEQIFKKIIDNKEKKTTTDLLMIAERSVYLESKGIKTGVDIPAAKRLIEKYKNSEEMKVQKESVAFNNRVIYYGNDMGYFTPEQVKAFTEKGNNYVSFARLKEITEQENLKLGGRGTGVNPLRAIKGSEAKIISPTETMAKNAYLLLNKFERNYATREFIDLALKVQKASPGEFSEIRKIDPKTTSIKISAEKLRKELEENGINTKNIKDSQLDNFTAFRKSHSNLKPTEIEIIRDGKREVYEVGKEFARMFKYGDYNAWNIISKYIGAPTRLIRLGATGANPEFSWSNVFTDSFTSSIISKNNYPPFAALLKGIAMEITPLAKKLNMQKEVEAFGISGSLQSSIVSLDRAYTQPGHKTAFSYANPYNLVTKTLDMARWFVEKSDMLNRKGNFAISLNKYLKDGVELSQAIRLAGFDTRVNPTDYFRAGAAVKQANLVSAFLSARIGSYKSVMDAFIERPGATFAKSVGYITTLSIYNWYTNHDDPDYQKLPQWRKDIFWNFKFEGDYLKSFGFKDGYFFLPLKKPFDLGLIFGTLPERFLDYVYKKDPEIINGFIWRSIKDTARSFIPIPDILKPVIEQYSNKSLFSGRDIVPSSLKGLPSEYQFNEYTSETAKLLGKAIESASGDPFAASASPLRIDNIIRNYLVGPFGQSVTKLTDQILIESGIVDDPVRPDTPLTQIPMVRVFFAKNNDRNSQHITEFYKEYEKIAKLNNAKKLLTEQGDVAGIAKIDAMLPPNYIELESSYKAMKVIEGNIKKHYNSKGLDGATKQYLIELQVKDLIDTADGALKRFKQK
jgi:hypothetical protein